MAPTLGELLPLAVGVAISPVPIIAAILILLSPHAKSSGLGFLSGWVAGIVVSIVAFTLLSSVLPDQESDGGSPVVGVLKIVLGALLVLMAVRQWRGRPPPGEQAPLPGWMAAIDKLTPAKACGLALLLSAVNPKNLLMAGSAGLIVGAGGLSLGPAAVVIAVYTVLAASTVLVPVVGYLVASARMAGPLDVLRTWLVDNNAAIMAVLLVVLGASMIGKGIGAF